MPTKPATAEQRRLSALESEVVVLRKALADTVGRLAALEAAISVDAAGNLSVSANASLSLNAGAKLQLSAAMVQIDTGMGQCSGVWKCDTLITNSVVASSYTPGAGNLY